MNEFIKNIAEKMGGVRGDASDLSDIYTPPKIFSQKNTPETTAKDIEETASSLRSQRLNWEKRWLLADRFAAGNHFETWKPGTNEISTSVFSKGMNVRPIHYAVRTTEGTLNNLISADPRWKVYPRGMTILQDEEVKRLKLEHASKTGFYLENLWDEENVREKAAEMIWNGLKYCFGAMEGYWEGGKPKVRAIEPYDILFDPSVKDIKDSPIVIKEVSVSLKKIQANEQYNENKYELKPDGKLSGSSFKEARLNERHGKRLGENDKVLIREAWIQNPEGGWDLKHICQSKILFEAHYDWKRHPFVSWKLTPEALLQTSWFERLIPLNRGIDITLAQIEMWVRAVSVGRVLKKKGVNIERIMGEHGEIIEVDNVMDAVQWLRVPEIGATPFNLLNEFKTFIAEIGASAASIGRVPRGARAGFKLVESLKASEMSSIQHGVRAFEDSLESLAEVILVLVNEFCDKPLEVQRRNTIFEIIGKNFANGFSSSVPVSDVDFGINVEISSGLGFTTEARQERAIQLTQLGIIDTRTALQILQIGGDTEDIARMAMEEYEKKTRIKAAAKPEAEAMLAGGMPAEAGGGVTSVLDADDFQDLDPATQELVLQELQSKAG